MENKILPCSRIAESVRVASCVVSISVFSVILRIQALLLGEFLKENPIWQHLLSRQPPLIMSTARVQGRRDL